MLLGIKMSDKSEYLHKYVGNCMCYHSTIAGGQLANSCLGSVFSCCRTATGRMNCWLVVEPCAVISLTLHNTADCSDCMAPQQSSVHSQLYSSQSNPKCPFGRTPQTRFVLFLREEVA